MCIMFPFLKGNPHHTHEVNCESTEWSHNNGIDNIDGTNDLVGIEISEPQQDSWSCSIFLMLYWVSQKIRTFKILMYFLYDIVQENDIFVPARLTWIDHIKQDYSDPDMYAAQICSFYYVQKG